jgi:hypothetical protein
MGQQRSPFTFVTNGIKRRCKSEIRGRQSVGVGSADVTQQCLKAGLLDEISIDLTSSAW